MKYLIQLNETIIFHLRNNTLGELWITIWSYCENSGGVKDSLKLSTIPTDLVIS